MLKHRNAKKALLDIIEELEKSQKDIKDKNMLLEEIPSSGRIPKLRKKRRQDVCTSLNRCDESK